VYMYIINWPRHEKVSEELISPAPPPPPPPQLY
jgi:hypothetical protein